MNSLRRERAAGIPERIRNIYNRVKDGTRLAPEQRADFVARAGDIYSTSKERHERMGNTASPPSEPACRADLVVMDYGVSDDAAAPAASGAGQSRSDGSITGAAPRVRRFNPATRKLE